MKIETPEFQGTHSWNRLHWAKDNLDGVQSDYRVVARVNGNAADFQAADRGVPTLSVTEIAQ